MSNAKATFFTTPIGRLVWGSVVKAQTKDADNKPMVIKTGPQAGQPTQRYAFGLAIAKGPETHWNQTPWGALIWNTAIAAWPQGQTGAPSFAWKVTDGDSQIPNKRNNKPCDQEGYKGHWILSFSSSFPPKTYNATGTEPVPADSIKTGFYVQVAGSVAGNDSTQNPGVYLNHSMVALAGFGPEIVSGPDPTAAGFGAGVAAPAGMSAVPVAGLPTGLAHWRPRAGRGRPAARRCACGAVAGSDAGRPVARHSGAAAHRCRTPAAPGWTGRDREGGRRCHVGDARRERMDGSRRPSTRDDRLRVLGGPCEGPP
jgi:hypothetical protein